MLLESGFHFPSLSPLGSKEYVPLLPVLFEAGGISVELVFPSCNSSDCITFPFLNKDI